MTISQERLDEIERDDDMAVVDYDERKELIRLARLGLWARESGIPALRSAILNYTPEHLDVTSCDKFGSKVQAALSSLPSGEGEK